jgi:hypothetical protein
LQGGLIGHGLDKNELVLKTTQGSNDFSNFLKRQLLWQISQLGHLSQIASHILRENRCLGLPSDPLIVLQAQTEIPVVLTV